MSMVTKDQLKERITLVRLRPGVRDERSLYLVKDLMQRESYDRPDRIGIGPVDLGIAFSVRLEDIAEVIDPEEL